MAAKLIYTADDEQNILFIIQSFLEREGYEVEAFKTGDALFKRFLDRTPDMVILDIMMPGTDGFIICRKLREISSVPIIILSAKDKEADYVTGISTGSDDYFTKPFSPVSLVMRVKAIFRRIEMEKAAGQKPIDQVFGDLQIDKAQRIIFCCKTNLGLTISEFNLLTYMIENKARALTRDELLNRLWGFDTEVETRAVDDSIKRIRKKLKAAGSKVIIETVWGFGFRIWNGEEGYDVEES